MMKWRKDQQKDQIREDWQMEPKKPGQDDEIKERIDLEKPSEMKLEGKVVLEFDDVHTGYPDREIIKGVSAKIHEGEFVGLIGSNGTGKSTLLKAVSGLLPVTQGKIIIEGVDDRGMTPKERARRMAVVPQSFNIDYDFTVRDIVMMGRNPYLGPRERESDKDRQIVEEAMKRTKTLKFADRLFNTLSGGERQKVIIARAIAQDTELILLDEPTSALDMHHAIEVMELIQELNREGKTVLSVLHDLNMAARYCDRMIMLHDGKVIADGAPESVMIQDNLRPIYDMKMLIRKNPLYGKPEVTPVRVIREEMEAPGEKVHLICGANTATGVIEKLDDRGGRITAGVIPENSEDYHTLESLGKDVVSVRPFSKVTIDLQKKNLDLMKDADEIYITDIPFGEMNVMNLYGLEDVPGEIYMHRKALESDYTHGEMEHLLDRIRKKKNIHIVDSDEEFLHALDEKEKNSHE